MHPDLERLIRLQALDFELQGIKRTVETEQDRRLAIEGKLEARKTALAVIRERLTENQQVRRAIEKDLAQVQTRLSRYKDQLMEVKTNKEYHAMQTEIAAAEAEVRKFEDRILESMVEGDDVAAEVKLAEQELTGAEAETKATIQTLTAETAAAKERLVTALAARTEVAGGLPASTLAMFENIARNRGAAVVEVRDGHCSLCHVRLRPRAYQLIRLNEEIIQCDSCQRILYYVPPAVQNAPAPASQP